MNTITAVRVRELLHYNPDTGTFTRRMAVGYHGRHKSGEIVGSKNAAGYLLTMIDGTKVYLHRVAVLYMTGHWPSSDVDHRDTNRSNNRWANLREVTRAINTQNRRTSRRDRKCGTLLGVKRHRNRWQARINHLFLGSFATEQEAHAAYVVAKRILHEGCTL